jgi:hypothetical protein
VTKPKYVLGSDEIARLQTQAALIVDPTLCSFSVAVFGLACGSSTSAPGWATSRFKSPR